jgi:hypothetical protein
MRWSLKSLCLAIGALAACFAVFANKWHHAHNTAKFVHTLEAKHAAVRYEHCNSPLTIEYNKHGSPISVADACANEPWYYRLLGRDMFSTVSAISIDRGGVRAEDLRELNLCPGIRVLQIRGVDLSPADLDRICSMQLLERLELVDCTIGPANWKRLSSLNRLWSIRIVDDGVDEEAFAALCRNARLTWIVVESTHLSLGHRPTTGEDDSRLIEIRRRGQ